MSSLLVDSRDIRDDMIPFVRREMVGSTNTIVYEMYKELGVNIDDEAARIMLAGIISETSQNPLLVVSTPWHGWHSLHSWASAAIPWLV